MLASLAASATAASEVVFVALGGGHEERGSAVQREGLHDAGDDLMSWKVRKVWTRGLHGGWLDATIGLLLYGPHARRCAYTGGLHAPSGRWHGIPI